MLELDSPDWANLTQAYGDASNVPVLFAKLRAAAPDEWDNSREELTGAIMHQGGVYTATYAIAPHLVEYAAEIGPGKGSDALLFTIAYASRGGPGPEVPEELEEAWEDAQDEARDLILERLLHAETSEEYTGSLIAGLLYLSGEWSAGSAVIDWCWGYSMVARCPTCEAETEIVWHKAAPRRWTPDHKFEDVVIHAAAGDAVPLDEDFEFDEDLLSQQIISLAAASGHAAAEKQMRTLFGRLVCDGCGSELPLSPKND